MKGWVPVCTGDGSWTLRHPRHGQACHSLAGAWEEALERYARPCRLRTLGLLRPCGVVRLLDVGTGPALNLAAARAELGGTGARLEVLTLEADADVLRSALELPSSPPDPGPGLGELRRALAGLAGDRSGLIHLREGVAAAEATVRLVLGDARDAVASLSVQAPFDAVFLDAFSPSVEPELWEPGFLAGLAAVMSPEAVLSTYSSAVGVRRALASVGLGVGLGPRVGTKSSGTLASQRAPLPRLGEREARKAGLEGAGHPPAAQGGPDA